MNAAPVIANYDKMAPSAFHAAPGYAAVTHVCCVCGQRWNSPNKRTAIKVETAIKVNKDGPYCILCLHLEMAARYAEARGYHGVREAMTAWRRHNNDYANQKPVKP